MSAVDVDKQYQAYLDRFQQAVGAVEIGAFTKYQGRLVKKLALEDFEPLFREYQQMHTTYQSALIRGDTINDLVVRLLREQAATLMLKDPVDL